MLALLLGACGRTDLSVSPCGDGFRQQDEACDGDDVGGLTCAALFGARATGQVACTPACTLDTSKCDVPLVCATSAGLLRGAPWPTTGGCPQHLGRSAFIAKQPARVRWRRESSHFGQQEPLVASNGVVFINDGDVGFIAGVRAINPDGTHRAWVAETASAMALGGADGGLLYVAGNYYNAVHSDGSIVWQAWAAGGYGSDGALVGPDGLVYFLGQSQFPPHSLAAFTPDGKQTLQRRTDLEGDLSLAPDGSLVGVTRHMLAKIDARGKPLWSVAGDRPGTTLVGDDGTVFFASGGGEHPDVTLAAYAKDGAPLWSQDLGAGCLVAGAAVDRPGAVYVPACSGGLRAISPAGVASWERLGGSSVSAPVLDAADDLIVTANGMLVALDRSGSVLWEFGLDGVLFQGRPVVLVDGALLVLAATKTTPSTYTDTLVVLEP